MTVQNAQVELSIRAASMSDVPALERLIAESARGLSRADYSDEQIEAAIGTAWGVDSQLILDGTLFVFEEDQTIVACGGWSKRRTLFGSDSQVGRDSEFLDPATDAARIRAFFVHPSRARQGIGAALLERCEEEAIKSRFTRVTLIATLPGQRLYERAGYKPIESGEYPLGGLTIRFVSMSKDLARQRP